MKIYAYTDGAMLHGYFPILCVLTDEYFYLSSVSIAVGSKFLISMTDGQMESKSCDSV